MARSLRQVGSFAPLLSLLAAGTGFAAEAGAPMHQALVVGNGAYQQLAQPEQCPTSARYLADAFRQLQFEVEEIVDGTNGRISAGIFRLARPAGADALTVVYFCGYGVMFEDRAFLIPVKADLGGPFRVLTEGILAKSIYAAIEQSGAGQGLVVLDVVETAGEEGQAGFVLPPPPGNVVTLVASGVAPSFPGLVGLRLSKDVLQPDAELGAVLSTIFEEPGADPGRSVDLSGLPREPVMLRAGPLDAPSTTEESAAPSPPPAAEEPAPPAPVEATASAPGAPAESAADEAPPADEPGFALSLSVDDRRKIQTALRRLGFYDGGIDGDFGPGTRAAVARYQEDAGEPATGRLTPAQALRLLAGAAE